jgi:uroporphyrinogen decarboxylase
VLDRRASSETIGPREVPVTEREVVRLVIEGKKPPYVPWQFSFTKEAREKLVRHFGEEDLGARLGNHFAAGGGEYGYFTDLGDGRVRDVFGVVWDRSIDKDIGSVLGCVLPRPTLAGYEFPDPLRPAAFLGLVAAVEKSPHLFRVFSLGFSLYERAWTLRGMEDLMMDFHDHPRFVRDLLHAIADYNVAHVRAALEHDIDAVWFGDDWGQQHGLQMGPKLWHEFLYPELARMYAVVREAGRHVIIHSCGDVDELFDDLVGIGVNCFNPFQPEVMDVPALLEAYRGRLSFFGGLSTQKTLPYGTPDDVRRESRRLLDLGRQGGYIFAPAHSVEGDVPLENMLAFIEVAQEQEGRRGGG